MIKFWKQLAIRPTQVETSIYGSVQPDPNFERSNCNRSSNENNLNLTLSSVLGGGSALDAGKIGRLIYEYDARGEADLSDDASLKRTFPRISSKICRYS